MSLNSKPIVEITNQNANLDFEYSIPTFHNKLSRIFNNKFRKNIKNEDYNQEIDFRRVKYIEINEDNNDYYEQEIINEYDTEPLDNQNAQTESVNEYETDKIIETTKIYPNPCYPNPCNSGKCELIQDDYYCKCPPGSYGKNCHLCK